jgi:hypothetical protein
VPTSAPATSSRSVKQRNTMSQMTQPFTGFPKIARLSREIVVTEKIDGTNGQINIQTISFEEERTDPTVLLLKEVAGATLALRAGSKSRFLTRKTDNFGFCKWAEENAEELFAGLGEGQHFGEWWGSGIQRGVQKALEAKQRPSRLAFIFESMREGNRIAKERRTAYVKRRTARWRGVVEANMPRMFAAELAKQGL